MRFSSGLTLFSAGFGVASILFGINTYLQKHQAPVPLEKKLPTRAQEILKYGPDLEGIENVRLHHNFVASLNYKTKTPNWVAEHFNESILTGPGDRTNIPFSPDPSVPELFRAKNEDYWASGYSRGHMAAASNHKSSMEAMQDTFLLNSNIVPQDYMNNAYYWFRLELFARDLAKRFDNVYLLTGPLYLPQVQEPPEKKMKKFVKFAVIGENDVAVPTHLFKIILAEKQESDSVALGAFIIPNQEVDENKPLTDFQVPVHLVEKYAGFLSYSELQKKNVPIKNLCDVIKCEMISPRQLKQLQLSRDLQNARTLQFLETTWNKLNEEGFEIDDKMKLTYDKKKQQLSLSSTTVK